MDRSWRSLLFTTMWMQITFVSSLNDKTTSLWCLLSILMTVWYATELGKSQYQSLTCWPTQFRICLLKAMMPNNKIFTLHWSVSSVGPTIKYWSLMTSRLRPYTTLFALVLHCCVSTWRKIGSRFNLPSKSRRLRFILFISSICLPLVPKYTRRDYVKPSNESTFMSLIGTAMPKFVRD